MISNPMRSLSPFLALAFIGCGTPDPCAKDPALCQDAGHDAGQDSGSGPGTCSGVCAPAAPSGWFATSLLWVGATGDTAPSCPEVMPIPYPGFSDTPPTVDCPVCLCTPSSASCLLPDQLSANAGACPGGGPGVQQFNASAAWDGTCNTMNPVSSADSLTVTPPPTPASYCVPSVAGTITPQGPTPSMSCEGLNHVAAGSCGDQSMICAYPKTDGFLTCISKLSKTAVECPDGWPVKHLFFGNDYACGCTCSAPNGDSCSATVTVYEDGACSNALGSVMVSSDQPEACVNVLAGSAFGSKFSTPPVYKAGTCTPSPTQTHPQTFCCLP
jgi:hypothetical protein